MGKGGKKSEDSRQAPTRKTKAAVGRRQNNKVLIKAVSARHCAATTVLRSCCPNCYAGQSHKGNVRSSAVGNNLQIEVKVFMQSRAGCLCSSPHGSQPHPVVRSLYLIPNELFHEGSPPAASSYPETDNRYLDTTQRYRHDANVSMGTFVVKVCLSDISLGEIAPSTQLHVSEKFIYIIYFFNK